MTKKDISIYIDDISKKGGTERMAVFLANYLFRKGWKIKIVTLSKDNIKNFYDVDEGVAIETLEKNTIWKLIEYMRSDLSDIMISISMGSLSFKMALFHKIFNIKSRLILSEHVGLEAFSLFVRLLKLASYRFANDLVLLTAYDLNKLNRMCRVNVIKIINPSSFQISQPDIIEGKHKIVLAVGRLTYQKNFHALLKIWASIKQKENWKLRIVGDGEDLNSLIKLINKLGLSSEVEIAGSTRNIEHEFKQAKIIAMTSRFEGLPLVLIEAKSFGVASVAFDCKTGPAEIIQDGEDGFLIPIGDSVCFSQNLQHLMTNDNELSRMQRNALNNAKKFSMQSVGEDWERLINFDR